MCRPVNVPGALRHQPPEDEEGEEGEVRHHLEGPPVPDVVGLQAQEHLAQGEGDLDGDPDEGRVPVIFALLVISYGIFVGMLKKG